ncbi:MAG TPA: hypothetical protein VFQ45_21090 [Longimicrobium sp.]|nr:hypothetical protein [Longimicrobium sp.]
MQRTYRAVLNGDHLRWIDGPPVPAVETPVEITLLDEPRRTRSNGKEMARALEKLARMGGMREEIPDPLEWQREIRRDRPLPGREG